MSCYNKQFSIIQFRRGLEADFVSSNIVLASGEPAYSIDNKVFKIGDGVTPWNSLPGLTASGSLLQFSPTSSSGLASLITDETGSGLVVFNTSPNFSGIPTAPTAPSGTNTNQIATTSFVRTEVSNLVDSAPQLLDTLNELAAAINDDANFYNTISNNIITVSGLLPTITNSGDNRILTSDGSTRGINAKNNLTFDGSLLNVNGSGNFASGLYVGNYVSVSGSLSATTKSFKINHPSKKDHTLEYGSLESPYHGIRLTGQDIVTSGSCTINLPSYIKDLIYESGINIQITNYKHNNILYVNDIDLNQNLFTVKNTSNENNAEFFWTFTGIRKDIDLLMVEKNGHLL